MSKDKIKNKFPQHLCKMCGKCCKAIIPEVNHEELETLAKKGDEEAKVFTEIFKKYESIEDAQKIVPEHVKQITKELQENKDFDIKKINFYYCPHITDKNLCSIHKDRPECCKRAPRHGWSLFPPGCGFKGWQFEQRERVKKSIRSLKEYLYEKEVLHGNGEIPGQNMTVAQLKQIIENKTTEWENYGAKYW